jgi:hypothetical protein
MLKIWRQRIAIVVMHDHDALTFMYPANREDSIIPQLLANLPIPIKLAKGRTLTIPYDCKTGWNKGEYDAETNPDGLKDYVVGTSDKRKRSPQVHVLDRPLRRRYG